MLWVFYIQNGHIPDWSLLRVCVCICVCVCVCVCVCRDRNRPVGPDPIQVRFARMCDRERIIQAFEYPTGQRETRSEARRPTDPRVTVRTDLPAAMKRERGRLAHIAYLLRSNQPGLKTRIKIIEVKVVLQTKKSSEVGSTWPKWSN